MRALPAVLLVLGVATAGGAALGAWPVRDDAAAALVGAPAGCGPGPGDAAHPGMAWVPGGAFTMGAEGTYPEEGPRHAEKVDGFWMDRTEVTNAQFAGFVAATGYRTLAERGVPPGDGTDSPLVAGSAVFRAPAAVMPGGQADWWQFVRGADWRHPEGPDSSLAGREQQPVVHVAYEDALAYARWKGHSLPTEAQFEYAAQSSARRNADGSWAANTWQGSFPSRDIGADGHAGVAPVACYGANRLGLYDLLGNVWEWTATPYFERHDAPDRAQHPQGHDPRQPEERAVAVVKGGSFLCSPDYCMRYRPEARIGQSHLLATSHIGFRTILAEQK
jgi:formylglycine-generating enzyme required for sulfatase activity